MDNVVAVLAVMDAGQVVLLVPEGRYHEDVAMVTRHEARQTPVKQRVLRNEVMQMLGVGQPSRAELRPAHRVMSNMNMSGLSLLSPRPHTAPLLSLG